MTSHENIPAVHEDKADPMLAMVERVMLNPDLPVERITALIDIRERQMAKEAEQAFNVSFAEAMAEMPDVPKNGLNKHTGQKYSTLDDLIRTARPVLSRHGLSLNWQAGTRESAIWVRAVVRHSMGHSIDTEQEGPRDSGKQMNVLQGGGSTETYLKRYTGFAILGLSSGDEVDDDGRGAVATITEAQCHEIRQAAEAAGVSEDDVCKAVGAPSLAVFPASRFAAAMKGLKAKADANGGK